MSSKGHGKLSGAFKKGLTLIYKDDEKLLSHPWIMFGAVDNSIVNFLLDKYHLEKPDLILDNFDGVTNCHFAFKGMVEVRKPDHDLLEFANTHSVIIVTFSHWVEMETQLLDIGYPKERIYVALRDFNIYRTFEFYAFSCGVDAYHPEPKILNLEISGYCNCHCVYCPFHGILNQNIEYQGFMEKNTLENVVRQISMIPSIKTVDLTGKGESFLHREWYEMIQFLLDSTKSRHVILYTN